MHELKGVGGNFGYMQITELCIKIEEYLKNKHLEELKQSIEQLHTLYQRILSGLEIKKADPLKSQSK